jgi:hypothetical protein
MASFEEDDDSRSGEAPRARGRGQGGARDDSWDRDSPDIADITPDDLGTVRCGHCKKYIFEDSVRCPYCKHLQLEEPTHKKPLWIIIAAILCILGFAGWLLVGVFDILTWFHR